MYKERDHSVGACLQGRSCAAKTKRTETERTRNTREDKEVKKEPELE